MTPKEIQDFLALGEGQRVEFKSSMKNIDALGRVICGFLNTSGGYLICGVKENSDVPGVEVSSSSLAKLEARLHNGISPKALISIQIQELENKPVVVIEVAAGKDVPYSFQHVIYIRDDDRTIKADAGVIRDIVMRRQIEPERWERRFSFADLENDVDLKEIQSAVEDAQKVQRAFFRDISHPFMVLEDLSVAKYGRLTNGGDVLFGSNPDLRLPQVRVRAMRYNSDKAGDTYSDMKSLSGPLHSVFEEAYSFIVRNTRSVSRFTIGNPKRHDSPIYPEDAVREALINAFAHRDYSASSGGVSIHIYPRRLEIGNSGPLPEGVTEENLPKGHISVLRNPDIAHVLYLRGLMEKAGRGSVLMVKECLKNDLPAPVWKSDETLGVTVTFIAPEATPEATPEVEKLVSVISGAYSRIELQEKMSLKDDEHFRKAYIKPALKDEIIAMTMPEKATSPNQKYHLTSKGKDLKAMLEKKNK